MKTCPQCAEEVQDAARVCKHCGHRFDGKGTPAEQKLNLAAGCIVIVLLLFAISSMSQCLTVETPAKPQKSAEAAAATRAQCEKVITAYTAAGVIKRVGAPSTGTMPIVELVVDDDLWTQISADMKKSIAIAPACVNDGGQDDGETYVDVKGYRSGKTLAEGRPGRGTLRLL